MTVYLLVDDRPEEFGGYQLLAIYQHRVKAEKRLASLKKRDAFTYQYCEVLPRTVITGRALPRSQYTTGRVLPRRR